MNRGNGGIFGKKNLPSATGTVGLWGFVDQQRSKVGTIWPSRPDPNFAYTPLLLKTSAQTIRATTVVDSSPYVLEVTRNGPQSTGWTGPYQDSGYWSNYFNGSTDYLSTTTITAAGTGSVTYECWFYKTTLANSTVLNSRSGNTSDGIDMIVNPSGKIVITYAGLGLYTGGNFTIATNTWYHLAVVRNGASSWTVYINGQVDGTFSNSVNITSTTFVVGLTLTGTSYFAGYISNVRVTNAAVYTANFTPATTPLTAITGTALLTCQDNRFKDNGPNNRALTVNGAPQTTAFWYPSTFPAPAASIGALYNSTKTDTLTIPNTTAITTLASDFTIETWVYPTDITMTGSWGLIETRTSGGTAAPWVWGLGYSAPSFTSGFFTGTSYAFTLRVLPYVWSHIVLQRNGSTLRYFVNGVVDTTTFSLSGTITGGSSTIYISNTKDNNLGGYGTGGYLADFRIVNGTAVYSTAGFTPPTTPLTAIANTSLLLNLADTNFTASSNSATNNVFIDSSPYSLALTRNGTATQGSFTPYLPNGNWSNYLDGSSYINFASLNGFLTTGPCTIEAWINYSSFSTGPIIVHNYNWNIGQNCGWNFGLSTAGIVVFAASAGAFNTFPAVVTTTSSITIGTWNHVAFVRDASNVCRIYINGVDGGGSATYAASFNLNSGTGYRGTEIGRSVADGGTYSQVTGYISNLRIVNGTAVYTTAFTPPTDPLTTVTGTALLTCQSNRFVDNSASNLVPTLTGTPKVQNFQPFPSRTYRPSLYAGSGYFNGSTDYVSTTQTFSLPTATTPFTMEAWVYFNAFTGTIVASSAYAGSGPIPFVMGMGTATNTAGATPWFGFFNGSAWTTPVQSSTSLSLNTWYHLAYVYTGSSATIYANGVSIGTGSISSWQTTGQSGFYVGRRWDTFAGPYFSGYISDFRLVIGTAVYTGTFTPPTLAPITFDGPTSAASYANTANVNTSFGKSQTVLLTNFANAGIYDAMAQNDIITVGSAQSSIAAVKWAPTSMRFNGSTDYLYAPGPAANPPFTFGTGNFTIEMWVYVSAYSTSLGTLYDTRPAGTASTSGYLVLGINSAGTLTYQTAAATVITAGSNLSLGVWYHVALCRSSGSSRLFINGTQTGSTYADSNSLSIGANRPIIASDSNVPLASGYVFNGFIQDLRVAKTARYTGNFTAPIESFGLSGSNYLLIEYLVVAGGGGGGYQVGGAGGAGGVLFGNNLDVTLGSQYLVTVGGGGTAGTVGSILGSNGSSSIFGSFTTIGGGAGGAAGPSPTATGRNGGSGGGAAMVDGGGTVGGGAGTSPQGNNGGTGVHVPGNYAYSGGGGGAGAVGANGGPAAGGIGIQTSITGTATYYAGGGGGGGSGAGAGGNGGGGGPGVNGTSNTGGGGGGSNASAAGGAGGSGVIVIAYPNSFPDISFIDSGLVYTQPTRSGYKVYRFTSGTGTIRW